MIAAHVVFPVATSPRDSTPDTHPDTHTTTNTPALPTPGEASLCYELRFQSLFNEGRALVFPCDAGGQVVLDALSERARENYLYARAVVGREFAAPAVIPSSMH